MANAIINNITSVDFPNIKNLSLTEENIENMCEFSREDKIILLAARRYMASTNIKAVDLCHEFFDLASQALSNEAEDFKMYLSRDSNGYVEA